MTAAGPVIASAVLGPGHDGQAEVVVELVYPNGGRTPAQNETEGR